MPTKAAAKMTKPLAIIIAPLLVVVVVGVPAEPAAEGDVGAEAAALPPVDAAALPPAAVAAVGLPSPETPGIVRGPGGADADAPIPARPPMF